MRLAAALGAGSALALGLPGGAGAAAEHGVAAGMRSEAQPHASILFAAFTPATLTSLVGDSVSWHNESLRPHTVSAEDGGYDSERIAPGGDFSHRFDHPGVQAYYCRVHPSMRGTVDVRTVLLDPAREPAAPHRPYRLTGRAALPAGTDLPLQADEGGGFQDVGTARVEEGGGFQASVTPRRSAIYRAVAATGVSNPVQVLVLDRRLTVRATTRGRRARVTTRVTPASPGATLVLQLRLREHFGWWPVARARAGRGGVARFRIPIGRRVAARVVLTLEDGATRLATSRTVHVGRRPS